MIRPVPELPDFVDTVVRNTDDLQRVVSAAASHPIAATILVQVLRHNANAPVSDGLLAESLAYSTLQHGSEFRQWLANRSKRHDGTEAEGELVTIVREGGVITLTLNRPERRNAYSAAMRDALCEALHVASADPTLQQVVLKGAGPAFCAGGDLDEFGAADDAALAHVSRTSRSAAMLLAGLSQRVVAEVHGACIGAGIELPAFAGRVRAAADSFFQLPEVAMGLIPGAGGTVSILARIGRLRTAFLALSGARIDAHTALSWGLVDELYTR